MKIKLAVVFLVTIIGLQSCEESYTPKSRAFFRIDFPEKLYQEYNSEDCPFSFIHPVYSRVYTDTSHDAEACWKNISFEPFDAFLHLSYKPIENIEDFYTLVEDSRTFVYKHTIKAHHISEQSFNIGGETGGIYYELGGNTATAIQFFLTDTSSHFIRGSLYFMTEPNRDSLQTVIDFLDEDLKKFIHSMEWKY